MVFSFWGESRSCAPSARFPAQLLLPQPNWTSAEPARRGRARGLKNKVEIKGERDKQSMEVFTVFK